MSYETARDITKVVVGGAALYSVLVGVFNEDFTFREIALLFLLLVGLNCLIVSLFFAGYHYIKALKNRGVND